VITLSPLINLDDHERRVRRDVDRDEWVSVAAATGDRRQVRQLRRLSRRLAGDPGLDCTLNDRPDGSTCLTVCRSGGARRGLGSWGDPKIS
jgi:hypothetical protein